MVAAFDVWEQWHDCGMRGDWKGTDEMDRQRTVVAAATPRWLNSTQMWQMSVAAAVAGGDTAYHVSLCQLTTLSTGRWRRPWLFALRFQLSYGYFHIWISGPKFDIRISGYRLTTLITCTTNQTVWHINACRGNKYYFSEGIVNIWNSLLNHVVDVNTVYLFKACLVRFWMNQDVKYDFTADLTGTGDRSVNINT